MTTRVVHLTSEPGCTSFVASRAACDMSTRGPSPMPCRQPVGFADEDGAKRETRFANANDVAELQVEASQQGFLHRCPEYAVFFAKRVLKRHARREDRGAEARP